MEQNLVRANLERSLSRGDRWLGLLIVLGLFYAYAVDLGTIPVDPKTDEGRRALVTAEMLFRHDFVTPTLYGEPYLNKPPLYNWLVATSFYLSNNFSAFTFRLPVLISIFAFGIVIFRVVKKYMNQRIAALTAIAFITNGRILVWDSLQGLIDIAFCLLLYTSMLLAYHFDQQKKYMLLFLSSYLFMGLAFLMKGLPALACQGITLVVYFSYTRRFKKLFSIAHVAGIFLLALILGTYYTIYFKRNSVPPAILFTRLVTESTERTVVTYGVLKTLLHLFTFPVAFLYHFAPWTILIVLLFRKKIVEVLKQQPFLFFNLIIFFANITIYWSSPRVYARYLFFLVPMLFTVFCAFYDQYQYSKTWQTRMVHVFFAVFVSLLPIVSMVLPFIRQTNAVPHVWGKALLLATLFAIICALYFRSTLNKLLLIALAMVVARIGFNWFVVEQRGAFQRQAEDDARTIAQITHGHDLFILRDAAVGNMDAMAFTITTQRAEVLRLNETIDTTAYYISDKKAMRQRAVQVYHRFQNHEAPDSIYLVKFLSP